MTTAPTATPLDFAAYWLTVLGDRSPANVVEEFGLIAHRPSLDEWLGGAESEARRMGAASIADEDGDYLDDVARHHRAALDLLLAAAVSA